MSTSTQQRLLRIGGILAVNLLAAAVLVELAGLVAYSVHQGGWFHGRDRQATAEPPPAAAAPARLRDPLLLHPYFGFVLPPNVTVSPDQFNPVTRAMYASDPARPVTAIRINNFGFMSDVDFPYARRAANERIIGVFGGSVAQMFALQGAAALRTRLQDRTGEPERAITILDCAQGGYKQPQQLLVLAYLLAVGQPFDAVVNVTGVNELALAELDQRHGLHPSMPNPQHVLPLLSVLNKSALTAGGIESLARLQRLRAALARHDARAARARSAAVYLLNRVWRERVAREYRREQNQYAERAGTAVPADVFYLWQRPGAASAADSLAERFAVWGGASLAMHRLCQASGIRYLEVVQPNQYHSRKPFTAAERAVALNPQSSFGQAVTAGYPSVPEFIEALRRQGVAIVSGLALFDDLSEPIYLDDCCHYNYRGYQLLGEFVADQLAPRLAAPAAE